MKKALKLIAQFFLVWGIIGLINYLSYTVFVRPVVEGYDRYGLPGAMGAIVAQVIIYTALYFIIEGGFRLFKWAFDAEKPLKQ